MLTIDQIDALREQSATLLDPVVEFLLTDIAQRIAQAGRITNTAAYEVWKLQTLGVSQRQLKKELRQRLKISHRMLRQMFTQAAKLDYAQDIQRFPFVQAVPFQDNGPLQQILEAAVNQAQDDLTNITQTMGFVTANGRCVGLTDAYRQASDYAFMKVSTGAQDYNSAIRDALQGLRQDGIQTIDYDSGVHTSVEAAVRRNIMGGLGLMEEQISQQNHDLLGCNGWEISAHRGSAPDHEPIQGKQYSDEEYKRLNGSLKRRIGTLNCGHSSFSIILGVNSPQYTPEELEQLRQENEKGVTVDGKHYTLYGATQQQRSMERDIRKQKHKILVDKGAGDEEQLQTDQIRLVNQRENYRRFSKAAGLQEQFERQEAAGFTWKEGREAEKVAARNYSIVETIGRSVGAKAKNYMAYNSLTGEYVQLSEGTRITQPKNHVIAGKGRNRQIDQLQFLLDKYGGDALEWTKEKGFGYINDIDGQQRMVELHWYQEPSVGRVRMKIKVQPDGRIYIDED